MAFNPNAVFISPSSLSDFAKCAQLYYLRNVYRSPKTNLKIQLLNSALGLGQVVHDTIEQYLALEPESRATIDGPGLFSRIWNTVCSDPEIFSNPDEQAELHKRGLLMVEKFMKHEHFKTAQRFDFPGFPKAELGDDIILTGKLDWIEKSGDGVLIVDFKTGKNEEREDSLQLPIYVILASRVLKIEPAAIKVHYWYLDKDEEFADFPLPDLNEPLEKIKQAGNRMKLVRETKSFACSRGGESCWACKDMLAVSQGKGKLISVDAVNRKQEIYILPKAVMETPSDLPF